MASAKLLSLSLPLLIVSAAACARSTSSADTDNPSPDNRSTTAPNPDPRVGLRAGKMDAEQAAWNLRLLSNTPPSQQFVDVTNSDLAFTGNYAIQGNYNGWQVWDIKDPRRPSLKTA